MRWSAAKLRWMLLGGVVLLVAVVAAFFGVARWKAGLIWQRILARSGVNLRQETNGFTISQSSGGRTVFTLHAAKATPLGNNRYLLHDAVMILYGRQPGRDDRISGKEIEYDQAQGVARAAGEVLMDLQVPEPGGRAGKAGARAVLGFTPESEGGRPGGDAGPASDPGLIHVRTSGLVYMRKMGLAATGEMAEFRYGGIACTSRGAEFDTGASMVRLLADVHMTGTVRKGAFTLVAGHAELSRVANTVDLTAPVLTLGAREARAAHALLHLRKDGDLEAMEASGTVQLRDGTRTVGAPGMTATFREDNRPEQARMSNGVDFADSDRARPARGSADGMELRWGGDGVLQTALATGAVKFEQAGVAADGAATTRRMVADQATASFVAGSGSAAKRAVLQRMHLVGSAGFGSETAASAGRGTVMNFVKGDDLTADFSVGADGRAVVRRLDGAGHTQLVQTGADGARQQSSGDVLEAEFAPGMATSGRRSGNPGEERAEVTSAVQTGHVEVLSWAAPRAGNAGQIAGSGVEPELTTGRGDKAVYLASESTVTLTGGGGDAKATVEQPGGNLAASTIVVHQDSGDADATGGVVATKLGNAGAATTHVLASRARLLHETKLSEFYGEAGRPAQMFQGGSQVQAAEILLDGKAHGLAARPGGGGDRVEAVFATESSKDEGGAGKGVSGDRAGKGSGVFGARGADGVVGEGLTAAGRKVVRVSAARMDYDDLHHEAVFTGDVVMRGVMGEVRGENGAAFLKSPSAKGGGPGASVPDLGGSLERMVMVGDVKLQQPGRSGVGEQLTYTAASDTVVLTGTPGKPPRITAESGSVVTGATLVMRSSDSTIVVAGTASGPKTVGGTRVHTETDLKK